MASKLLACVPMADRVEFSSFSLHPTSGDCFSRWSASICDSATSPEFRLDTGVGRNDPINLLLHRVPRAAHGSVAPVGLGSAATPLTDKESTHVDARPRCADQPDLIARTQGRRRSAMALQR